MAEPRPLFIMDDEPFGDIGPDTFVFEVDSEIMDTKGTPKPSDETYADFEPIEIDPETI